MRCMVLVKATAESEAGRLPSGELLAAMGTFNEELVRAGVMLAGEGLRPSAAGARLRYSGAGRSVTDGPFAETKELIAGFWLLEVASLEEAVAWLKKAPFQEGEVEIRPVAEPEDFAASDPSGELRDAEARLRARVAAQQ